MPLLQHRPACTILTLLLATLIATGPARAAAPLPPIESFFENSAFSGAVLSPNARYLAVKMARKNERDGLAVVDLSNGSAKIVAGFTDSDVGQFAWVNDERLLYNTLDKELGVGDMYNAPGLYAINRDGSAFRQLAARGTSKVQEHTVNTVLPWNTFMLGQLGAQNSQFVYVTSPKWERGELDYVNLLKLDTLTGRATGVHRPADTFDWLLDQKGEPRIAETLERDLTVVYYRDPATDAWRKIGQYNAYTGKGKGFNAVAFGPDGVLYVTANAGHDKTALYRFDLANTAPDAEPLVELKDYDFRGALVIANNKLLGVHLLSDARSTVWFDAGMKAMQQRIDTQLPGLVNLISVAPRAETPWVLVQSYSDTQPHIYHLFNTESGKLNKVGETFAAIDPARMGMQEAVRYKARDGLEIPAWLTLPHGSARKDLPLVVLVHGGPYVRGGEWGWHPDAQFLASRGYAVLEPEYRGSTGFGSRHFHAGWKQWGLKMQDDIADGAKWAIAEGIVDPKRICIAGASYGGYATLMGLVNDPGLYKCGINWAGVTDIGLMHSGHWSFRSDMTEGYKQYGMPELVGDIDKDAEQLKATSPLFQAARIKQPLLMAYGGADRRVPIYHGRKFYDAVKAGNPNVEMIVYEEEGHGWRLPQNRIDFWSRVEKFLDKNIGKP
ncbi:MAG: dipeptidyl aminopeptidase [Massilia sp.]|jgi:dipeptidyl aminopeptidase/acylaminoacyl peptidase|nr:dipeptidyl aminopeptidase [Massilia sp.]